MSQQNTTSLKVVVTSTNLSEDFSITSSKNDELMLLIYESDGVLDELAKPVFLEEFSFREGKMKADFEWLVSYKEEKSFIFFLLEIDSDKTELQIDPILRVHSKSIIECFDNRDYLCIEKYLGDEDLLGYQEFSIPSILNVNGVYKLDKFDYTILIE